MTKLKILQNRNSVLGFLMVVILFFSGCNYDSSQKNGIITITLVNLRERPKDQKKIYNDSIQIRYTQINEDMQQVCRTFFITNRKSIIINYLLIQSGDSITYIKPLDDSTRSVYINLNSSRPTHLFFTIPQQYLEASLRYIKMEKQLIPKKRIDKLLVLCGRDVGFIGSTGSTDSLYYYFDQSIHLRKITSKNGEVLYCDKNYLLNGAVFNSYTK